MFIAVFLYVITFIRFCSIELVSSCRHVLQQLKLCHTESDVSWLALSVSMLRVLTCALMGKLLRNANMWFDDWLNRCLVFQNGARSQNGGDYRALQHKTSPQYDAICKNYKLGVRYIF